MSDTIYLVVSGQYSDYGVDCAFTDEARAQRYCDERNADHRVEAVDLDPPLPSEVSVTRIGAPS